ncbi:MAG: penicillin-binding protein [Patescibacteria group bacterium]|jgi:1A family penicillin-binding protein
MPIPQLQKRAYSTWKESQHSPKKKSSPKKRKPVKNSWRSGAKKPKRSWWPLIFKVGLILALLFIIVVTLTIFWFSRGLPNPNQLMDREVAQSTKIYDRTGENIIYEISGEERRTLIELADLPDYVKNATIAIEDKTFYKHRGFSVWAMFRTLVTNVIYRRSAGGSTLTQQFIKNAVLTNEKKLSRKLKELILAYRLEQKFSKDDILQMYLNEIPYGSNAYGVEAASRKYFGKNSKDLTLAEAATLAALPQSPSRYSPYGPNKDILLGRKDYILSIMVEQGFISKEESEQAKAEEIVFKGRDNDMTAPHFVMYIKSILSEKYGEKMIEQGGLNIYTTLDLYKQNIAEEVIKEKTEDYPEKYNAHNAALVSIDPKTGEILAMVGSRDYFNDEIDGQVNVTTRLRQPGSSMKPIVYAALFEKGYTPNTILYDVITNFSTNPADPYTPRNYDGQEHGPVSIRQALAGSLNIPAVKAIYLVGINNVLDLADQLGYSSFQSRDNFGLSLVLGGGEVRMIEHVNAFSAFARDGKVSSLISILRVEDGNGRVLEENKPTEKKVLDSQVARMINNILSDTEARSFIFGSRNYLTLNNRPAAVKTGTTNDFHDAWTVGYTPSLVTGVWVGNSNNDAMTGRADGSVLAAPIWQEYMNKILGDTPVEYFKDPDDYTTGKPILDGELESILVSINKDTNTLADDETPLELIEEISLPQHHSILFYVDKDKPRGDIPKKPEADPQFVIWEKAIKTWATKNASSSDIILPDDYDPERREENRPKLTIISPQENAVISDSLIDVNLTIEAKRKIAKVDYYLNNLLLTTNTKNFSSAQLTLPLLTSGYHNLKVRVCDDINNCQSESVNFNLSTNNDSPSLTQGNLTIIQPGSGVSINNYDFPLTITFNLSDPQASAQLRLYQRDSEGEEKLLASTDNLSNQTSLTWNNPNHPGIYYLYGELVNWNNKSVLSPEISAVLN